MQDRTHIDDIHTSIGGPEVQDGLLQPVLQLVPLLGLGDVLVVFEIVENHEVRAVRTVAQAAHTLSSAEGLELDVLSRENRPNIPDTAPPGFGGEVHSKARVAVKLGLDRFKQDSGLLQGVGDD